MVQRDPRTWLTRYLDLQRVEDTTLQGYLEEALRDAEARIAALRGRTNISSIVETAQLNQARIEILRILDVLWDAVRNQVASAQARANAAAVEQSFNWDDVLLRRIFPGAGEREAMRNSLRATASRNVEAAVVRMTGFRYPLSQRVYRAQALSNGWMDRRINSNLARGTSWAKFQADVRDFIRPDTPGGVAYAAKRLARTEINLAYHAMSVEHNRDKPWNTGIAWNLSRSHPVPDICNLLADRGPYAEDAVPAKPHPQCLCYVTPETVTPEAFVQNYRAGQYDEYIASHYGVPGRAVA